MRTNAEFSNWETVLGTENIILEKIELEKTLKEKIYRELLIDENSPILEEIFMILNYDDLNNLKKFL